MDKIHPRVLSHRTGVPPRMISDIVKKSGKLLPAYYKVKTVTGQKLPPEGQILPDPKRQESDGQTPVKSPQNAASKSADGNLAHSSNKVQTSQPLTSTCDSNNKKQLGKAETGSTQARIVSCLDTSTRSGH